MKITALEESKNNLNETIRSQKEELKIKEENIQSSAMKKTILMKE